MSIVAYADGGCSPNPGPGGWGVHIETPEGSVSLCGGEAGTTTNNRMELTAAIRALEHFPEGTVMEVRCDSQLVVNTMTSWIKGWKAKGWRTTTGEVKNVDLVKRLDEVAAKRKVRWTWVKGHSGNDGNEKADALVHKGRAAARRGIPESEPVVVGRATASAATAAPSAPVVPARTASVPIDMALGLEMSRAAKAAGVTPQGYVEEAVRLALSLGPDEVARLSGRKVPA